MSSSASIERNGVARVVLRSDRKIWLDTQTANPRTGRAVLIDNYRVVAGLVVEQVRAASQTRNLCAVALPVTADEYARKNGHSGGVLWLTGLSGAGKSTIATAALRALFDRGRQVVVLDGDNIRHEIGRASCRERV